MPKIIIQRGQEAKEFKLDRSVLTSVWELLKPFTSCLPTTKGGEVHLRVRLDSFSILGVEVEVLVAHSGKWISVCKIKGSIL